MSKRRRKWFWFGVIIAVMLILRGLSGPSHDHQVAPVPVPSPAVAAAPAPVQPPEQGATVDEPVAPVVSSGHFTQGAYEVPSEMPTGKYKTTGDQDGIFKFCMATTYGDVAGEHLLKVESTNDGPAILVVGKNVKRVDFTGDCEWIKQ
jgi:hypothetical protein